MLQKLFNMQASTVKMVDEVHHILKNLFFKQESAWSKHIQVSLQIWFDLIYIQIRDYIAISL